MVIGSINLDSKIDEYQTGVAQFWHAMVSTGWTSFLSEEGILLRRFIFVGADACSQLFYEFFGVTKMNSFL